MTTAVGYGSCSNGTAVMCAASCSPGLSNHLVQPRSAKQPRCRATAGPVTLRPAPQRRRTLAKDASHVAAPHLAFVLDNRQPLCHHVPSQPRPRRQAVRSPGALGPRCPVEHLCQCRIGSEANARLKRRAHDRAHRGRRQPLCAKSHVHSSVEAAQHARFQHQRRRGVAGELLCCRRRRRCPRCA